MTPSTLSYASHLYCWLPRSHTPDDGLLVLQTRDAVMKNTYLPDAVHEIQKYV